MSSEGDHQRSSEGDHQRPIRGTQREIWGDGARWGEMRRDGKEEAPRSERVLTLESECNQNVIRM